MGLNQTPAANRVHIGFLEEETLASPALLMR